MGEEIKKVLTDQLQKSGEDYKQLVPVAWETIREEEVGDYIALLKESPDFVMDALIKLIPKTEEYIQLCDPEEFLIILKNNLPQILEKIEGYGIERFFDEIRDPISEIFLERLPEIMEELERDLQRIDLERLNSYVRTLREFIFASIVPFTNRCMPHTIKLHRDIEDAFGKLKGTVLTIGVDLKDMDLRFKEKIDKGVITAEEGLENADVAVTISTKALVDGISVLLSGSNWKMTKYLLSGPVKVRGSVTKLLALIPFALKLSKLMKKTGEKNE